MSLNGLLKKGGLQRFATAIPAIPATDAPATTPKIAKVAGIAAPWDDRTTCTQCSYLALGNKCLAYRRARLATRDLAADFVSLKQRCDGFAPVAQGQFPLKGCM